MATKQTNKKYTSILLCPEADANVISHSFPLSAPLSLILSGSQAGLEGGRHIWWLEPPTLQPNDRGLHPSSTADWQYDLGQVTHFLCASVSSL